MPRPGRAIFGWLGFCVEQDPARCAVGGRVAVAGQAFAAALFVLSVQAVADVTVGPGQVVPDGVVVVPGDTVTVAAGGLLGNGPNLSGIFVALQPNGPSSDPVNLRISGVVQGRDRAIYVPRGIEFLLTGADGGVFDGIIHGPPDVGATALRLDMSDVTHRVELGANGRIQGAYGISAHYISETGIGGYWDGRIHNGRLEVVNAGVIRGAPQAIEVTCSPCGPQSSVSIINSGTIVADYLDQTPAGALFISNGVNDVYLENTGFIGGDPAIYAAGGYNFTRLKDTVLVGGRSVTVSSSSSAVWLGDVQFSGSTVLTGPDGKFAGSFTGHVNTGNLTQNLTFAGTIAPRRDATDPGVLYGIGGLRVNAAKGHVFVNEGSISAYLDGQTPISFNVGNALELAAGLTHYTVADGTGPALIENRAGKLIRGENGMELFSFLAIPDRVARVVNAGTIQGMLGTGIYADYLTNSADGPAIDNSGLIVANPDGRNDRLSNTSYRYQAVRGIWAPDFVDGAQIINRSTGIIRARSGSAVYLTTASPAETKTVTVVNEAGGLIESIPTDSHDRGISFETSVTNNAILRVENAGTIRGTLGITNQLGTIVVTGVGGGPMTGLIEAVASPASYNLETAAIGARQLGADLVNNGTIRGAKDAIYLDNPLFDPNNPDVAPKIINNGVIDGRVHFTKRHSQASVSANQGLQIFNNATGNIGSIRAESTLLLTNYGVIGGNTPSPFILDETINTTFGAQIVNDGPLAKINKNISAKSRRPVAGPVAWSFTNRNGAVLDGWINIANDDNAGMFTQKIVNDSTSSILGFVNTYETPRFELENDGVIAIPLTEGENAGVGFTLLQYGRATVRNGGTIRSNNVAIDAWGDEGSLTTITNETNALMLGNAHMGEGNSPGIYVAYTTAIIENDGEIAVVKGSNASGVGAIRAVSVPNLTLTNGVNGIIGVRNALDAAQGFDATQWALLMQNGGVASVSNAGTMHGHVEFSSGNDTLTNTGAITGSVIMGDGNDLFTLSGEGTVGGAADGGGGANDRINLVATAHDLVISQAVTGFETVEKTGSFAASFGQTLTTQSLLIRRGKVDIASGLTATIGVSMGDGTSGWTELRFGAGSVTTIGGGTGSIQGDLGAQWIDNRGTITGALSLGAGDDYVSNRGGITGSVLLGDGNDGYVWWLTGSGTGTSAAIEGGSGTDVLLYGVDIGLSQVLTAPVGPTGFEGIGKAGAGTLTFDFGAPSATNYGLRVAGGRLILDSDFTILKDGGPAGSGYVDLTGEGAILENRKGLVAGDRLEMQGAQTLFLNAEGASLTAGTGTGAFTGSSGAQTVENRRGAQINAALALGDGNDRVINRFGTYRGGINLGAGDDVLEVYLDATTGAVGGLIDGTPDGGAGHDAVVYSLEAGRLVLGTLPGMNPGTLLNFEGIGKGGDGELIFAFPSNGTPTDTGTMWISGPGELATEMRITTGQGDGKLRLMENTGGTKPRCW